jgi:ParB family chromosome partitioning protein
MSDDKLYKEIAIDLIRPNPYQPRKQFDEKKLSELSESIAKHGVFTPILVKQSVFGYELVAGERRLRASKLAGLTTIPAIVDEFDDETMMEIALIENIQREDLNVIEEAEAYKKIMNRHGYTQEELSDALGKSRGHISNYLRLLNLPKDVQLKLSDDQISVGHAKVLLGAYSILPKQEADETISLLTRTIIDKELSVRKTEIILRSLAKQSKIKKSKDPDIYIKDLIVHIEHVLSTKVSILDNKLQISFCDTQDLNRILEVLNLIDDD